MKQLLTLVLICFSIGAMAQSKPINIKTHEVDPKSSVVDTSKAKPVSKLTDSTEIISIEDIRALMTALENEPGFTKHDYDRVNQSIGYLIQISTQRRNKKK